MIIRVYDATVNKISNSLAFLISCSVTNMRPLRKGLCAKALCTYIDTQHFMITEFIFHMEQRLPWTCTVPPRTTLQWCINYIKGPVNPPFWIHCYLLYHGSMSSVALNGELGTIVS